MKRELIGLCAAAMLIGCFGGGWAGAGHALAATGTTKAKPAASGGERNGGYSGERNGGYSNVGTDGESGDPDFPSGGEEAGNGAGGENGGGAAAAKIEKAIAFGMTFKGTPYEFGSNRGTTETFDCSDFMRWIFKETIGLVLPMDSRQQGAYVRKLGTEQYDWHKLNRGDLMFFMTYKGAGADAYKGVDRGTERITHVGIYLGDGKILHTYSNASGGVHVGTFAGTSWELRFLFGGSVLPKT